MPRPTTKVELQQFLGCVNFFHCFLPDVASTLAPLHALTSSVPSQKSPLLWSEDQDAALMAAKEALCNSVKLAHPDPVAALAYLVAFGGVLTHEDANWASIAFFCKELSPAITKYRAFDRELLGVYLTIRHFRHMLEGRPFAIWTDHKPLCGALNSSAEKSQRQTCHLSFISEFSTDIRHVAGSANVVADVLSRAPSSARPVPDQPVLSVSAL